MWQPCLCLPWSSTSPAGTCWLCQLQGAPLIQEAGPAPVCVQEAFCADLREGRATALACCQCLPAEPEDGDGNRNRKQRWKLEPREQPCSWGSVQLTPSKGPSASPWPPAESFHYPPDTLLGSAVIGEEITPAVSREEISVSSLAITFLFLLPSSPKSLSLSHKS